jgi:hypothetical protein
MSRGISSTNPQLIRAGEEMANDMVEFRVEDMAVRMASGPGKMWSNAFTYDGEVLAPKAGAAIKPAKARSAALGPSTWAFFDGGVSTISGAIPSGAPPDDLEFDLVRAGMLLLADNTFYVEIMSNDPDYIPDQSPQPDPQAVIEYHVEYAYCTFMSGQMQFGVTGEEWYNNKAKFGDGDVSLDFTLTGSDDPMYESTLYFMTSMNDAAWNVFSANAPNDLGYLFPFYIGGSDCGGCDFGVNLGVFYTTDGGLSYNETVGDVCHFAVIDSMQAEYAPIWPHQTGPSIGIHVVYKEIGTYGADFGDFKLVVAQINNRNPSVITDLYYGMFSDWDIGNDLVGGNIDFGYMYMYDEANTVYGHIGLPLCCSYWCAAGPSVGDETDPMYNGRAIHNPTDVYPPADYTPDSLFAWIDNTPEGELRLGPNANAARDDHSYLTAFGKVSLDAAPDYHQFGFAVFGIEGPAFEADIEALARFVNKYAGFGVGDVNNDDILDLRDLVYLNNYVSGGPNGPVPFRHLGDVDCLGVPGVPDADDCAYLAAYFFNGGPAPISMFIFAL